MCNFNASVKAAGFVDHNDAKCLKLSCPNIPVILKENFVVIPAGIGINKNSYLFSTLEEVLQLTIPAGIPQYNLLNYESIFYKKGERNDDDGPKILFVGDLSFGFVMWLAACGVSFTALVLEIIAKLVTTIANRNKFSPTNVEGNGKLKINSKIVDLKRKQRKVKAVMDDKIKKISTIVQKNKQNMSRHSQSKTKVVTLKSTEKVLSKVTIVSEKNPVQVDKLVVNLPGTASQEHN